MPVVWFIVDDLHLTEPPVEIRSNGIGFRIERSSLFPYCNAAAMNTVLPLKIFRNRDWSNSEGCRSLTLGVGTNSATAELESLNERSKRCPVSLTANLLKASDSVYVGVSKLSQTHLRHAEYVLEMVRVPRGTQRALKRYCVSRSR